MTAVPDTHTGRTPGDGPAPPDLGELISALQSHGVRVEAPVERRTGGAGPSDSGMLWLEGRPVTVPTVTDPDAPTPYVLVPEDGGGNGIYRDGRRLAGVSRSRRPRFYDLSTADGVPYEKIALLHLDSLASTVVQACNYWNTADQCTFCGIGVSLDSGATIARKTPEQLAEVSVAARDLDGVVDVTLTTGSSTAPDRGARYVARCGRAVKDASGLPVEIQFEPPRDLGILDEVHRIGGADAVGIHVESFDPQVLARVAPGKFRTGIETYFRTWERAVELWGRGRVSTYVILGMGEDPEVTVEGCRRAIDIGVYPFVVPLRPVAGSLMADQRPPSSEYSSRIYRRVAAHMSLRGMSADDAVAGCARCQACSAIDAVQRTPPLLQIGPRPPDPA
ncbi:MULTISPECIES: MSMEG_0568 family radical SAM protein [Pseudonocardia]|uniref:Radical SAM superfamily protein n=2 Tax=Pseudonocardia TaxID=1847 RepID=A0A1Y2N7Q1_PSEAH|nr:MULTISPECIES: MSMEG_0568 family radical SAM protein [Pseudonocardia]OSY43492.1 Radical SAM superfamily protein [Pseudonocardia autotrophica]TDN73514.1 radical SAM protein (TIGR04043 family) [Pseudonocardia autotrophica]BBG04258.1 radical SAM protein [Pseudonocardia autotrophica]GEC25599.1 radical SAM protein [Pseudonocardia saturnea]